MAGLLHLCKRFFGAVRPGPPSADDEAWATRQLLIGERDIWVRMNNPDRRHAVAVARAVVHTLQAEADQAMVPRPVVAAALLHDSGKVVSGFRTPARVAATVWWAVADDAVAEAWEARSGSGLRARMAQYRNHPRLGAELLEAAGSDRLTSDWAAQHHLPELQWTVPVEIGRVLKSCDDD